MGDDGERCVTQWLRSRERPARVAPHRVAKRSDWTGRPAPGEALERSRHYFRDGEYASGVTGNAGARRLPRPGWMPAAKAAEAGLPLGTREQKARH
jgi:hypothetical protein